ncbi:unnamed protein product [Darwinula stevensoni]|uniref:Uncharacterized protein n=1 Tax=Darwinula stevensoni TaxID=69355 RepID=A0A7R9AFT8_9CRUS|nr:unnamed protein product [Darwinula stevensoni]CAG0903356.1 unnamed protein product [Darwinula stevensoni]
MRYWALALFVAPGFFAVAVSEVGVHRSWSMGRLAQIRPEGGIEGSNGQYVFESGEDIKLLCTLTEAGVNKGLTTSDLRFQTPSDDLVKPHFASNKTTVILLIANASVENSGRYNCGNVSNQKNPYILHTVDLEIDPPPLGVPPWRCRSEQLENLFCSWVEMEGADYSFFVQGNGMEMIECEKPNPDARTCTVKPPLYHPGEREMKMTVVAQSSLRNGTFSYPFHHHRNIRIKTLENFAVEAVGAETLKVTWDLPAHLVEYNFSIVHKIKWVPLPWNDVLFLHGVEMFLVPGASKTRSWNRTLMNLIPNTEYDVFIKAIIENAEFPDLGSSISKIFVKTLPKAPDRSPDVPLGSFHVERIDDGLRDIHLYWIPLSDWEHFSDNFTYQNVLRTEGGKYFLEWKEPEDERVNNYTVYWCISPPSWPFCDSVNWTVATRKCHNFELESIETLKFAISANGLSGSSGMGWEKSEQGSGEEERTQEAECFWLPGETREARDRVRVARAPPSSLCTVLAAYLVRYPPGVLNPASCGVRARSVLQSADRMPTLVVVVALKEALGAGRTQRKLEDT